MPRSRKTPLSNNCSFEQNFIVENAFKRNNRYFNLSKLNQVENGQKASRRRPFSSSQKSIDQKINNSFMNTTAAFSEKVQQEIDKFKLRMSYASGLDQLILGQSKHSARPMTSRSERNIGSRSARSFDQGTRQKKKIRGMSLDKYCSRQQYYQSKSKPVLDERLFNNYSEEQPDLIHTRDFQKYLERNLDFALKNFHQIQYNAQKLYEKYYYKKTTMQCNFNYKSQKRTPRQFYTPKNPEGQPATQLSPQRVKQSFEKCTMSVPKPIQCFYSNSGKQLPSQLDMRFNNNLTNQWVDNRGKIVRKVKEYSLRKMKKDLVDAKLQEIKQRKKPKFQPTDLCDRKYYRVNPPQ